MRCRLWLEDPRDVTTAVERCRRLLDLDADPGAVASHLGGDPLIGRLVRAAPGLRVPGAVDGAELAVRAVLGQQVSLPAARTAAGRLVAEHGEALARPRGTVTALFPVPAVIAALDPARLGMPRARAGALVGLCRALADGDLLPGRRGRPRAGAPAAPRAAGRETWTAGYVAIRALGDPDVFLAEDLGVRHALRRLGGPDDPRAARALGAAWAPWRSYATQHLWHAPASGAALTASGGWHDPGVTGFGPEHLPYGVFRRAGEDPRVGARLGDGVLDLAALASDGPLDEDPALFAQASLNAFMAAGRETWARVREALHALAAAPDAEPATVALADVSCCCRSPCATTSTSTRRWTTRRTWAAVPPPRGRAAAELAPPARRLSRALRHAGGQRHPDPPPARPAPGGGRRRARLRPQRAPGHRARAGLRRRRAERARRAGGGRSRARPRLRRAAGQRLERPRPPGVGVPPARALPGQVVRDFGGRVGHAAGGDPRSPRPARYRSRPRCPTSARSRGPWTSTSRSSSTAPSSRVPARAISTGRRPSSSRT